MIKIVLYTNTITAAGTVVVVVMSSKTVWRFGLHLIQSSSLGFRYKDQWEYQTNDWQYRIGPKSSWKSDILSHVHKCFDARKRADVTEPGSHRRANISILKREYFPNQKPGNRIDPQAESADKCDNTKEWDPVKFHQSARIEILVVREGSKSCQCEGHKNWAEYQERQSAEIVAKDSGSHGSDELNNSCDDSCQMRIERSDECVPEYCDGVKVESDHSGKSETWKQYLLGPVLR